MSKEKKTEWEPSIAFLIDLLSIVTLKSIILGCNNAKKKVSYEQEADEIMNKIDKILTSEIMVDNPGKLIRAIQIGMLSNRLIWENETKARLGGEEQNHLLPLTHSLNGMRQRAGNEIIRQLGGREDLNIDRVNEELIRKFGFDVGGIL